MKFWPFGSEKRSDIPNGSVPVSASNFFELMGRDSLSTTVTPVTTETALGVPAIWAAVNFMSGTLAGLPLNIYRKQGDDRKKVTNTRLAKILHDAVNDELSSFDWRKGFFEGVFTGGRGLTYIERNRATLQVLNLWPLDPTKVEVRRQDFRTTYVYEDTDGKLKTYDSSEIIDLAFMRKADGISHRGPIATNKDVIALAIAATEYGSKFFSNGGVPPFAVTGDFKSHKAMARAGNDFQEAVRKAAKEERQALMLPAGLNITSIGADAEKAQLVSLKQFSIEEFARIYSLPPTFLQDLSKGTFANTEQQDLHFVKHTIKRWVEQFEQELNLKLFGRDNNKIYVELNMDGLLRGDFKTRMEGYATSIQNAILSPNEVRRKENMPEMPNGNDLLIQGATVPLGSQPVQGELNLESDADDEGDRQIVQLFDAIQRGASK